MASDFVEIRCHHCGRLITEAQPGSVVRGKCRRCRLVMVYTVHQASGERKVGVRRDGKRPLAVSPPSFVG